MKKIMKRSLSVLLALICAMNLMIVSFAEETVNSGTCGTDLTWTFDAATGELVISGTGEMNNYSINGLAPYYVHAPWYSFASDIKKIVIEDGVTTIGWFAFYECVNVTDVAIPDSVTEIGYGSFRKCTSLTEVTIPASMTIIENFAFSECTGIKDIYYKGSLEDWCSIDIRLDTSLPTGYNLYFDGILVDEIVFPDGFTEIRSNAFKGCSSITEVTIPDGVHTIGWYSFYACSNLSSVKIPGTVTKIGQEAFYNCDNLKEIYYTGELSDWCEISFYDMLFSVGHDLFINEELVENLVIPDTVTEIKPYAFQYCYSILSVTIPQSVKSIGAHAFEENISIENVFYKGNLADWLEIEFETYANPLNNGADFYIDDTLVESIGIPGSIEIVNDNAFIGCQSLVEVVIADGVTGIGECAFTGCVNLERISIPDSVDTIGDRAFSNCEKLSSINIPDGVKRIGKYTFDNCNSLTEIVIPDSVMEIDLYAFRDCSSLSSVKIPDSVTTLDSYAFNRCTSLTEIIIPGSVSCIGSGAFSGCTGLTDVFICNGVTEIDDQAFRDCTNLTTLTIPVTVTTIGYGTFGYSNNIKTVNYCGTSEQWRAIDIGVYNTLGSNKIFNYKVLTGTCGDETEWRFDELSGTLLIEGSGEIEGNFANWDSIKDYVTYIEIADGITGIGENAFEGFSVLKEVYAAKTVQTVSAGAFAGCSQLSVVTVLADDISVSEGAFVDNDSRLFFVAQSGSQSAAHLADNGFNVSLFSVFNDENMNGNKTLLFSGETVCYDDLEFAYISNLVFSVPDLYYIKFDKMLLPDSGDQYSGLFDIEYSDENIEINNGYVALKDVYFSVRVNGKVISFSELMQRVEDGDYSGILFGEYETDGNKESFTEQIKNIFDNISSDIDKITDQIENGGTIEDVEYEFIDSNTAEFIVHAFVGFKNTASAIVKWFKRIF